MGRDNPGFAQVGEHRENPEYGFIVPIIDKRFGNHYGKQVEELLDGTDDPWAADAWVAMFNEVADEKAKAFQHLGTDVSFTYPDASTSTAAEDARPTIEYWRGQMMEAARNWQFSTAQEGWQGLVYELEALYARLEQEPLHGTIERVDFTPILP